ncbi:MAG TPA: MarR family transcriptional regulator [Candidatus Limnocylindrales bacterium]|nr:MarR family transcriptional regulator [Candidatus Limnocylindrales bacterium]
MDDVTSGEGQFVEEMGQFLASLGMTPMAGRMWGWLLICDPPEQTAADIAEALHASRGAISGTARLLATSGLIRRTTRRGDRREYFSAPPEGLDSLLGNAAGIYRQMRGIAERGLAAIAARPVESRARLQEFHDVMAFVELEVPKVISGFLAQRDRRTS